MNDLVGEVVGMFPLGSLKNGDLKTFFQRPQPPKVPNPWKYFNKAGFCCHTNFKEEDGIRVMVTCNEPTLLSKAEHLGIDLRSMANGFLCVGHQGDVHGYRKRVSVKIDWDRHTVNEILESDHHAISIGTLAVVASTIKGGKLTLLN